MFNNQKASKNLVKIQSKNRPPRDSFRTSLLSLIFYPLALLIIVSAIFGSTLIVSLVIKKIEAKDHERVEALEEAVVGFLNGEREKEKLFHQYSLVSLKEKTNFEISLYDQAGLVASSMERDSSLRQNIPFESNMIKELLQGKVSHVHRHLFLENGNFKISYYPFSVQAGERPLIAALISPLDTYYGLRNQISLIVSLGIVLILGLVAFFLVLILKIYITAPAKKLIAVIQEVKGGSLDVKVPAVAYGEIGDLAENFSLMVDKLKEAKEREKEVSRMKTEILSIAAHHLRTPLSGIKWSLKMVLNEELGAIASAEQKDMLKKTYQSNEQMIVLINDILDVSKIEESHFGFIWSYGQMENMVEAAIEESAARLKQARINLSYLKPKEKLPKVKTDPAKLHLVLNNLLDNAIKYSATGGAIKISLAYKNFEVVFSIRDRGIGIPRPDQNKLFSKFFRASNVTLLQSSGTGLGLFIARSIIEKHGGKLWFKSEEAKGSTFYFSLPVERKFAPKEKYEEFLESV